MKILSFLLGGLLGVLLIAGGAVYFLLSGDKGVAPPVPMREGGGRAAVGENLLIRGKIAVPPSLAPHTAKGAVMVALVMGDRINVRPMGPPMVVANPQYPLDFELEITKEAAGLPTPRGGSLHIRVAHCINATALECSWPTIPSLRGRSFVASVPGGKSVTEALGGKDVVEMGEIFYHMVMKRADDGCLGGRKFITGTVELAPAAQAAARGHDLVLVGLPIQLQLPESGDVGVLMKRATDFRFQRLSLQGNKAEFAFRDLSGDNGNFRFLLRRCRTGQPETDCIKDIFTMGRRGLTVASIPDYFEVAYGGYEIPACGDTGVRIIAHGKENPQDPSLPEEVRIKLSSSTPAGD